MGHTVNTHTCTHTHTQSKKQSVSLPLHILGKARAPVHQVGTVSWSTGKKLTGVPTVPPNAVAGTPASLVVNGTQPCNVLCFPPILQMDRHAGGLEVL